MHLGELDNWRHTHTFGTDVPVAGERRTLWVIGLTSIMMVAEIAAGLAFGSMALLADGWHMATHAAALGIAAFAYVYARRHASDSRYSFGTGKVGALGGFASAVALAVVALLVLGESVSRFLRPVAIHFDQAITVAVIGLAVNLVSALLLREEHEPGHDHHDHHGPDPHGHSHGHRHPDHNLRAAYLHVLADALTSLFAVAALTAGKFLGWTWMDPVMGVVGAVVIARWSSGLVRDTGRVLLDAEVSDAERHAVVKLIESEADSRVVDLHLWRVGPRHLAAIISLVTHNPREPVHYRTLLRERKDLVHVTVEVHRCSVPDRASQDV